MGENLLRTYYQGITQRLRGEVDFINGVLDHHGLRGEGNEIALRDLLQQFIPKRFGVGTGVVIDRKGTPSRQCDIVIYDKTLYPGLLSLGAIHLFPVDVVYGTVEVKTTLTSVEAARAIENIRSVRSLDFVPEPFIVWGNKQVAKAVPTPPLGFVFAYNSDVKGFTTFHKWFVPNDPADRSMYPNLVGCLDQGLVRLIDIDQGPTTPSRGIACVWTTDDGSATLLPPDSVQVIAPDGARCPVKEVDGRMVAIDQTKALLFFLLMVSETLSMKHINPEIRLSEYYLHGSLRRTHIQDL